MNKGESHFSDIASKISKLTGISTESSEEFLKSFLDVTIAGIEENGDIEIPNFGIFRNFKNVVSFSPSPTMEKIVNSAFSDFEPVILDPDFPTSGERIVEEKAQMPESDIQLPPLPPEDTKPQPVINDMQIQPSGENTVINNQYTEPYIEEYEMQQNNKTNPWLFWTGLFLGLLIGFIAGLVLRPVILPENYDIIQSSRPVEIVDNADCSEPTDPADSAIEDNNNPDKSEILSQETNGTPSQEILNKIQYDTIREGRYLAKISRDHFGGRPEYWIYIYLENKDKIKDPGSIPVGTILAIPDRNKYGIDPDSPESIAKANKRILQFYNTGQ